MLVVLLGLLLILLPLAFSTGTAHVTIISLYIGVLHWVLFVWVVLSAIYLLRIRRVHAWRNNRWLKRLARDQMTAMKTSRTNTKPENHITQTAASAEDADPK